MIKKFEELGSKHGVCEKCGSFVPIKVINDNGNIFYLKKCKLCGEQRTLISVDADYYEKSNNCTNALTPPIKRRTVTKRGCPYDCGLCENHTQRICMAMVETTDDCNVHCKTCIAGSCPGGRHYISLEDLKKIIVAVKNTQDTVDLLMLSGGEPTIHPQILEMIDLCKELNVRHTMLITNGVKIAQDEEFVARLSEKKDNIEIYLQFDSLRDSSLLDIRGDELTSQIRRKAVENLEKYGIHFTLVCILKKNVNDNEVKEIIEFALEHKYARGVTFQPLKDVGRGSGFDKLKNYITLSEARRLVANTGYIPIEEMLPHPCNGNCICIGYLNGEHKPITSYLFSDFKHSEELKNLMYYLPYLDTKEVTYKNLFRITVVSFLDKYNFTLEDVKKCCIDFVTPDGSIVPFDTHYEYH